MFVCLALFGCSSAVPLSFQLGPEYTPEERSAIQQAADQWNAVTKPENRIDLEGDGSAWTIRKGQLEDFLDGDQNGTKITTQLNLPIGALRATAAHEFGHALGLAHTCAPKLLSIAPTCEPGVMYPGVVADRWRVSATDLEECRRDSVCP